mmetsp:Transcript_32064/g.34459  ORF Transcript_32064/g.34459 Transcript_32064/m.34459 type:complete len:145 (+) Transcript_32064:89-523(+)
MMMIQNFPFIVLLLSILISMLVLAPMNSLALGQGSSILYPAMPTMNTTTITTTTVVGGENNNNIFDIDIDIDSMHDFLRDAASPSFSSSSPSTSPPTSLKTRTVANFYTGRHKGQRGNSIARNFIRLRDMLCNVNLAYDNLLVK